MFTCFYDPRPGEASSGRLAEVAYSFSPLIEETDANTVVFDVSGSETLFGSYAKLPLKISSVFPETDRAVKIAVASNPDLSIHAARGLDSPCFVSPESGGAALGGLELRHLCARLVKVDEKLFSELLSTLHSWGIRTFGQFAALPQAGVSERLGPEGVRLQQLAAGKTFRAIMPRRSDPKFRNAIELEHPIESLEPLLFVLARLLNELCSTLIPAALGVSELLITLTLQDGPSQEHRIQLPFAMRDSKTLLKIIELDICARLPVSAVRSLAITVEPGRPRILQKGLFQPGAPEPEKLELQMARIAKIVGRMHIGCPELLNSHRPDAFRIRHFRFEPKRPKSGAPRPAPAFPEKTLRRFRPPLQATVQLRCELPVSLRACSQGIRRGVGGNIVRVAGPWRSTGEWWTENAWYHDEWDIELADGTVCRIFRNLTSGHWFVEGIYD